MRRFVLVVNWGVVVVFLLDSNEVKSITSFYSAARDPSSGSQGLGDMKHEFQFRSSAILALRRVHEFQHRGRSL